MGVTESKNDQVSESMVIIIIDLKNVIIKKSIYIYRPILTLDIMHWSDGGFIAFSDIKNHIVDVKKMILSSYIHDAKTPPIGDIVL